MNDVQTLKYIPQELKLNALWCGWKLTEKGKVPFNLSTGGFAKSNDKTTFCTYMTLLHNIHKYLVVNEDGSQKGGVGLGIFNGYSAIDIDKCVDENGTLNEMAQNIVDFCQSYTEYSPSKTGVRIIFKTQCKINKDNYYINNHNNGLEIYISDNTNKFVTITGNKICGDIINDVDIQPILDRYMKKSFGFDINSVLDKDSKLKELWYATAPGSHADESERDMALCCKLAYYLKNDTNEVRRYFEMSPYFNSKDEVHKKKWERSDYAVNTINGANNYIGPVADLPRPTVVQKQYELNDTGNARRFVERFGDDIRYNVDNSKWMLWNGKYWQTDVKDKIRDYVEILAEEMTLESNNIPDPQQRMRVIKNIDNIYNSSGKNNLLKESQHIGNIPVMNSELDCNPYLLCADNGVYNLKTYEFKNFDKSDMISQTVGGEISFDEPTLFIKFLNEMFENNNKVIDYIQKAIGYSATNTTREQCMFILQGDGNNGKSLLLEVISEALGSYSITSRPQLLTEQPNGNSNLEEIARLKGKRFITVEELKMGDRLDESLVKSLTSGIGNQVARFLYGNSFEFTVTGKIWMATNYEPNVRGTDKGIWRRIKKIPVNVDFTGREDKDLKYKLLDELPQIRGWIVNGCKRYFEEGLNEPDEIIQATKEYREENDIVQKWLNEYCITGSKDLFEQATPLWECFNSWAMHGNMGKFTQTFFGRNMAKKFKKQNFNGKIVYYGVKLKDDDSKEIRKKALYNTINVDLEGI